jgi:1,4-dihydroxy-6-naphthoate synthase
LIKISIAYSPDSDDSFMMWALKNRLVSWGEFEFEFYRDDIHQLNKLALERKFDITAISMAHYPSIAQTYLLLPVGSSIGESYGPALVTTSNSQWRNLDDLKSRRIAIPGRTTSAYVAAYTLIGDFDAREFYFKDIMNAVMDGEVDAGILIHEEQMDPTRNGKLRKLADLGLLWHDRFNTALPLGGNAIARDIPQDQRSRLSELLQASIVYGLSHRGQAIKAALQESAAPIDDGLADQYINQYVNQQTVHLDDAMSKAVFDFVKTAAAIQNRPMAIHHVQDIFSN